MLMYFLYLLCAYSVNYFIEIIGMFYLHVLQLK